jgi:hypothetical protein
MNLRPVPIYACLVAGLAFFCFDSSAAAQVAGTAENPTDVAAISPTSTTIHQGVRVAEISTDSIELPDAPLSQQTQVPAPAPDAASSSSSSQVPADADRQRSQAEIAEEQLKQQQKQRILGVVPNFNTSYVYGAASLTTKQKFRLAFRSAVDPVQIFGVSPFVALIGQANADHYGYGGGIGGYSKRYGQTFADNFDGTILGNAVFPSLLHQDPRYFRLGRGSGRRRLLYALGTNVLARHDHTGKWEPNYSNILGNLAAGGISNLYLPQDERGFGSTVSGALTVTAEGGIGSLFQEFWPDISRRFFHKDPTNGQDAINKMKPDPTGGGNPFSNHKLKPQAE